MTDTRQKILAMARTTVQDRGYGGLSFRDLAKEVGIKSASIHHYFPSKGDLGAAVAEQYTADFKAYLDGLPAASLTASECIARYVDVFRTTLLNGNRMCLGGIMAAEHRELPAEVQAAVVAFSRMNVAWLASILSLRKKSHMKGATVEQHAFGIYAGIEGAQLVARGFDDVAVYDKIIEGYRTSGLLP